MHARALAEEAGAPAAAAAPDATAPDATAPDVAALAAARQRRVRRSAIVLTLIAAAFYFGFIAMILVRSSP